MLNGFEMHVYNHCKMYSNLEKMFNLDPSIIPWVELSTSKLRKYSLNILVSIYYLYNNQPYCSIPFDFFVTALLSLLALVKHINLSE